MEADSTTFEGNLTPQILDKSIPFPTHPDNLKLYLELTQNNGTKSFELQIVEKMQNLGLLPKSLECPSNKPNCNMICKPARVVDRVQWSCEGCGKRLPIRTDSIFLRLQCSLLQGLQMILVWCEDADYLAAAEYFGVKPKIATLIYDRLDELAIKEHEEVKLGGEGSVVLAELYPDCLNRLSPDTTDQPHVHRILMMADTNHVPTAYKLHVIRDDWKRQSASGVSPAYNEWLRTEVEQTVQKCALEGSLLVSTGATPGLRPLPREACPDLRHFLGTRLWREAITLCVASADLCGSGAATAACAVKVQRYLGTALWRRRSGVCYRHVLQRRVS